MTVLQLVQTISQVSLRRANYSKEEAALAWRWLSREHWWPTKIWILRMSPTEELKLSHKEQSPSSSSCATCSNLHWAGSAHIGSLKCNIFALPEPCRNLRDSQEKSVWSRKGLALRKYMVLFWTCTSFKENISIQAGNLESISLVFGHRSPLHAEKSNWKFQWNPKPCMDSCPGLGKTKLLHKNAKLPISSH